MTVLGKTRADTQLAATCMYVFSTAGDIDNRGADYEDKLTGFILDNSTGDDAYFEDNTFHITLKPRGEQPVLQPFKDDAGNIVSPAFQ